MSKEALQHRLVNRKPVLAITMGDAAGVGPEVIVRALMRQEIYQICSPMIVGDTGIFRKTIEGLKLDFQIHCIRQASEAHFQHGSLDILDVANIQINKFKKAQVDPMTGAGAVRSLIKAIELAMSDDVDGIVTAPLHKMAIHQAGFNYPGHTEILAEKSGTTNYAMMFAANELHVILVTIHCELREALDSITRDMVLEKIILAHQAMQDMGYKLPKIGVAGINPHAGEGGIFGRDEIEILQPAIQNAQSEGINVSGPYPADTLFTRAMNREFDIVVAMYHDQGLIPVKLVGFGKGVNITLGLPFVRTSPDHGTAFDIAWKWKADPGSMITAIEIAARMAPAAK